MRKTQYHRIAVTDKEFDTILAALRLWQKDSAHIADGDGSLMNIAEEHGDALTNAEIDDLIERIKSKDTINDALLLSKLDPKVLDKIAPIGTIHPARKQMLSVKAALALTEIENKKTQVAVAAEILSEPSKMSFQDIRNIIDEAKEEPTPERAQATAGGAARVLGISQPEVPKLQAA